MTNTDSIPTPFSISVSELIDKLRSLNIPVEPFITGSANTAILTGIKPLEFATPSDLSFVTEKKEQRAKAELRAKSTKAGCLLVSERLQTLSGTAQIVTPDPMAAVLAIARVFYPKPRLAAGVDRLASVHPSAVIGKNVSVGPYAVLQEGVVIGDNAIIHPHVVIYPYARIGAYCEIHSSAVIREYVVLGEDCLIQPGVIVGGDGFGYIPDPNVGHRRIPHVGTVVLGDRVDLGANSTVDRGTLGETFIDQETKIDNLVMVGHNVRVGKRTIMCSQVGISGSTTIGNGVLLAGQVGVADHISIADGVRAAAQSGITGTIRHKSDVSGFPAMPVKLWRKNAAVFPRLIEIWRRLRAVEKKLGMNPSDSDVEERNRQ